MRRAPGSLAASSILVATLIASSARAQAPAPPSPAPPTAPSQPESSQPTATDARALAETLFFTARGLIEAGRYPEACGKLSESYRLDPAAGTLLNLAVCNQKIGKIASAWGEYRDALSDARRMNRQDRVDLASAAIKEIEPQLPFLTIKVPANVRTIRGLEITRNGIPIQSAAWDIELPVDPGQVEVVERAPLYKPKTLYVTVAAKEHGTLSAEPLELAPVERPPQAFWTGRRTAGALLLLAGVGAAVGGSLFGIQAIHQKQQSDQNCGSLLGQARCTQTAVDDMNTARTDSWISDGLFGLAVVGVGVGSYFFATQSGGHEQAGAAVTASGWKWNVSGGPKGATGWLSHSF